MLRILLLILVVLSSVAFAQIPINSKSEAKKVNEFGRAYNEDIEEGLDLLAISLQKEPKAAGHITTYGSEREIARREWLIRNHLDLRKFDISRIIFVKGGFVKEVKSEFWFVPEGAEPPKLIPTAKIFAEIGRAINQKFKKLMEEFYNTLQNEPVATGYLINYGRAFQILL